MKGGFGLPMIANRFPEFKDFFPLGGMALFYRKQIICIKFIASIGIGPRAGAAGAAGLRQKSNPIQNFIL
jgi:hypothetical protein